jgi:hypothetical protein
MLLIKDIKYNNFDELLEMLYYQLYINNRNRI